MDIPNGLLVRLEIALHDADCPSHGPVHLKGHGDRYAKLAKAAVSVFPPDREPYWLRDRKLIQETALNLILERLDAISKLVGGSSQSSGNEAPPLKQVTDAR